MAFEISFEQNGVYTKHTGIVTSDDIQRANKELWEDARWDSVRYEIVDLTDIRAPRRIPYFSEVG